MAAVQHVGCDFNFGIGIEDQEIGVMTGSYRSLAGIEPCEGCGGF